MTVGELFIELGFHADTMKLNEFISDVGKLNMTSVLASLGVKELYDGMKEVMSVASEVAMGMNLFGKETGLSSQKMQQWDYYAQQMGVQAGSVQNALTGIQKKLTGLALGTDQSLLTPLYMLNQHGAGITNEDLNDPFKFLDKAIQGLQKMPTALRTTTAAMLGLNEQLLVLKGFKDADNINVPNQDQIDKLNQYTKTMIQLGQTVKQTFVDIAAYFSDDFKIVGDSINGILKAFHNLEPLQEMAKILLTIAEISVAIMFPWTRIPILIEWALHTFRDIKNFFDQDAKNKKKGGVFDVDKAHSFDTEDQLKSYFSHILHPNANSVDNPLLPNTNVPGAQGQAQTNYEINQKNDFHINGGDPQAVAQAVDDRLRAHIDDAKRQQPNSSR